MSTFIAASTAYGLLVASAFIAAGVQRRARGLLLTLGVLGVLAPLAVVAYVIWFLSTHPLQIG